MIFRGEKFMLFAIATVTGFASAQDYVDECPEPNGLYADAVQCDRYYECKNGQISDKLCPDGLVYDESSIQFAKCSFPFSVDCTGRPDLQPAKPTNLCPRLNGYFPHEDPKVCDQFYFCVDGVENRINCPESLIFNPKTGQCAYSDQIERPGCSSTDFFKFSCPNNPNARHAHPRYPDPSDCQYFYLCLNGKDARRNGCQTGLVFNTATDGCDRQDNLEQGDSCRNWYNETVLDELRGPSGSPILPSGVKKTGTGIKLETDNRKRVQVVRRKKPRPQAQQPISSFSDTPPRRVLGGSSRVALDSGFRAAQQQQQQQQAEAAAGPPVRTRVRRPPLPGFQEAAPETIEPRGPPQFALSDADAIQRFRDQNRLVPQSTGSLGSVGGGRLTVLSGSTAPRRQQQKQQRPSLIGEEDSISSAPRPTPFTVFNRNRQSAAAPAVSRPRPAAAQPIQEQEELQISSVPESGFGNRNRFRSRRPPAAVSRTQLPASEDVRQLPDRSSSASRGGGGGSGGQQTTRSRSRTGVPSRGRLQVSQIQVEPQFDLGGSRGGQPQQGDSGSSPSFSSFPSIDSLSQY